jgi:hypothetical protein
MIYTTIEKINTRLRQRLQLGGTATAYGRSVMPNPEIEQIADQVESRVNLRLKAKYQLPLNFTDPDAQKALASIVEKLVACDILAPNFSGIEPSDEGGYIRSEFCMQGSKELEDLMKSYIDGEIAIGVTIGAANRAPVVGLRTSGVRIDF